MENKKITGSIVESRLEIVLRDKKERKKRKKGAKIGDPTKVWERKKIRDEKGKFPGWKSWNHGQRWGEEQESVGGRGQRVYE